MKNELQFDDDLKIKKSTKEFLIKCLTKDIETRLGAEDLLEAIFGKNRTENFEACVGF